MRTFSITGIRLRRRVRTTIPDPVTSPIPDLFQRDFTATEPGLKYMGDITYLPLEDGEFLYLATVLDCFSRKAVGWSIADHMRTDLVADALRMAAATRGGLDGAVFHSDHGAQYGSVLRGEADESLVAAEGRGQSEKCQVVAMMTLVAGTESAVADSHDMPSSGTWSVTGSGRRPWPKCCGARPG